MYNNYRIRINWKELFKRLIIIAIIGFLVFFLVGKIVNRNNNSKKFEQTLNEMKEAAKNYYNSSNYPKNIGDSETLKLENMIKFNILKSYNYDNSCKNENSYAKITKTSSNEYVIKTQLSCDKNENYTLETISVSQQDNNNINNNETPSINNNSNNQVNNNNNETNINNNENNVNNNIESNTSSNNTTNNKPSINNEDDDDEDKILENAVYDKDGNLIGITEYEFKKPVYSTTKNYVCPEGYALEGKMCYKYEKEETVKAKELYFDDEIRITDAKKNETEGFTTKAEPIKEIDKVIEYCPEGYTENNNTCYKYKEATVIPGTTTYTCDEENGFILDEKTKKCVKTVAATKKEEIKTTLSCKVDSDKLDKNTKTCSYDAKYNEGTTACKCDDGSKPDAANKCYKTNKYTGTVHYGTTACKCDDGSTPGSNNQCSKTTYYTGTIHYGSTSCKCNDGSTPGSNNQCSQTTSYTAPTSGYWSNPKETTSQTQLSTYNNGKEKRELANSQCSLGKCTYTYYTYTWITTYSNCSDGSRPTSSGICYSTSYYTATNCSTSPNYYTCKDGHQQSSATCSQKTTYTATNCTSTQTYYTCKDGHQQSSSECSETTSYTPTNCTTTGKGYVCEHGGELNDKSCSYKANEETEKKVTYSCDTENGYVLDEKTNVCKKTVDSQKNTTETQYTCDEGYIKEGSTCYKTTDKKTQTSYKYSCPEGYNQSGENNENMVCSKYTQSTVEFYCEYEDEILEDGKCKKTIKGEFKGYQCSPGYILEDDKCIKKTTLCEDAKVETSTKTSYKYKWSTSKTLDGWSPTGNKRTVKANEYIK